MSKVRNARKRHSSQEELPHCSSCAPRIRDLTPRGLLKMTHSSLEPYESLQIRSDSKQEGSFRVTFMGVSTILLDDGETAIMFDGFFSRPGLLACLFGRIKPDQGRISYALRRADVKRLRAVLTAHSHYDHAMDSSEVARATGAILFGSRSTANIARGSNLPEDQIRTFTDNELLSLGRFRVTPVSSPHSPNALLMGHIESPLRPPVRVTKYQEGGNYSFLVKHGDQSILIHPSANYLPGFLNGVRVDVGFISIGTLGKQSDAFITEYWSEVVTVTGAKIVVPIHWDDFMCPLTKPLKPMRRLFDDFERAMDTVLQLAEGTGVSVRLLPAFQSIDISALTSAYA